MKMSGIEIYLLDVGDDPKVCQFGFIFSDTVTDA